MTKTKTAKVTPIELPVPTIHELLEDEQNLIGLHTAVQKATGKSMTSNELAGIFGELPSWVQQEARSGGFGDETFVKAVYVHFNGEAPVEQPSVAPETEASQPEEQNEA